MQKIIENITSNQKKLFEEFDVPNNYYLKILPDVSWTVFSENDMNLVKYTLDDNTVTNLILNTKDSPMIYDKNGYTMIIAIDCVKVALVFENSCKDK